MYGSWNEKMFLFMTIYMLNVSFNQNCVYTTVKLYQSLNREENFNSDRYTPFFPAGRILLPPILFICNTYSLFKINYIECLRTQNANLLWITSSSPNGLYQPQMPQNRHVSNWKKFLKFFFFEVSEL